MTDGDFIGYDESGPCDGAHDGKIVCRNMFGDAVAPRPQQRRPPPLLRLPPIDPAATATTHTVRLKRRVDWLEIQMAALREQVAELQRQVAAQERRT